MSVSPWFIGVRFTSRLTGNDVLARQTTPAQGQLDHDRDHANHEGREGHDDQADEPDRQDVIGSRHHDVAKDHRDQGKQRHHQEVAGQFQWVWPGDVDREACLGRSGFLWGHREAFLGLNEQNIIISFICILSSIRLIVFRV
jgi:hypothetical protein